MRRPKTNSSSKFIAGPPLTNRHEGRGGWTVAPGHLQCLERGLHPRPAWPAWRSTIPDVSTSVPDMTAQSGNAHDEDLL